MSVKVRFAPSPTGLIHVGNVRAALVNWLFCQQQGGEFILRIDDTDLERSTKENEAAIKEDLQWLGIQWNDTFNQLIDLEYAEALKARDARLQKSMRGSLKKALNFS